MKRVEKIAILGGGLLGGSLALNVAGRLPCSLWARRESAVEEARAIGISDATSDLSEALDGAELVILTVPVGAMKGLCEKALLEGLSREALVSDVGSVKRVVHRDLGRWLGGKGVGFIGGHPMAGSEARGVSAARSDLFEGAACLLTDDEKVGEPWCGLLEKFWKDAGCKVRWSDAGSHDELVARISHFPHVMAAAAAKVALDDPTAARFGGGGLRDTTRVAGGDPSMWAEILLENRRAVGQAVKDAKDSLGALLGMLERDDHEAVFAWLDLAQRKYAAGQVAKEDE